MGEMGVVRFDVGLTNLNDLFLLLLVDASEGTFSEMVGVLLEGIVEGVAGVIMGRDRLWLQHRYENNY